MPPGEDPDSIIKAGGADDLRKILAEAKDFLDFQIDHKSAVLDLHDLGDRMQFAHEVAEGIALVKDKILRESAVLKVATRLGIPDRDLRESVADAIRKKSSRTRRESSAPDTRATAAPLQIRNKSIAYLCQVLLTDARSRESLIESESPDFFGELPETGILEKIWKAKLDLRDPANLNSFLSTLAPPEEACLSQLILEPLPDAGSADLTECVRKLKDQSLENQLEEKKSLMNRPNNSQDEIIKLQKEFLDLQRRLNDISPFAPRSG